MKKLLAFIQALCISSLALIPTVGNALYTIRDINSPDLDWLNNGDYTLLDKKYNDYLIVNNTGYYSDEQIKNTLIYFNKEGTDFCALIPMNEKLGGGGAFNLTDGTTEEEVEAFLSEKFAPNFQITMNWQNSDYAYSISRPLKECREICKLLKEENFIDSFVIIDNVVQVIRSWAANGNLLAYSCSEEKLELMQNYVKETDFAEIQITGKENRLNAGVYTNIVLVPKTDITIEERLDMAFQILNDTGCFSGFITPTSNTKAGTSYIDVFNAVDGDANEDGSVNMGDVVAVIQHIGNRDEYELSLQGEFNADTDGDGLTGMDAVEIQMKIAEAGMPE